MQTNFFQLGPKWVQLPSGEDDALTEQRTRDARRSRLDGLTKPGRGVGAISAYLRRAIETGAYGEGDRLPPERQLAVTFQRGAQHGAPRARPAGEGGAGLPPARQRHLRQRAGRGDAGARATSPIWSARCS